MTDHDSHRIVSKHTRVDHRRTGLVGDIAELLAQLESDHHRDGWDNTPATLYVVMRHPDSGELAWQACRLGVITGQHPRVELEMIAQSLADPGGRSLYAQFMPAAPIAWLLVMEAWQQASCPRARYSTSLFVPMTPMPIRISMLPTMSANRRPSSRASVCSRVSPGRPTRAGTTSTRSTSGAARCSSRMTRLQAAARVMS